MKTQTETHKILLKKIDKITTKVVFSEMKNIVSSLEIRRLEREFPTAPKGMVRFHFMESLESKESFLSEVVR